MGGDVFWESYEGQPNPLQFVLYGDVAFNDQLGSGMRRRQKPDGLYPGLNVTYSTKQHHNSVVNRDYNDTINLKMATK